jgi:hypothetical protein
MEPFFTVYFKQFLNVVSLTLKVELDMVSIDVALTHRLASLSGHRNTFSLLLPCL